MLVHVRVWERKFGWGKVRVSVGALRGLERWGDRGKREGDTSDTGTLAAHGASAPNPETEERLWSDRVMV